MSDEYKPLTHSSSQSVCDADQRETLFSQTKPGMYRSVTILHCLVRSPSNVSHVEMMENCNVQLIISLAPASAVRSPTRKLSHPPTPQFKVLYLAKSSQAAAASELLLGIFHRCFLWPPPAGRGWSCCMSFPHNCGVCMLLCCWRKWLAAILVTTQALGLVWRMNGRTDERKKKKNDDQWPSDAAVKSCGLHLSRSGQFANRFWRQLA